MIVFLAYVFQMPGKFNINGHSVPLTSCSPRRGVRAMLAESRTTLICGLSVEMYMGWEGVTLCFCVAGSGFQFALQFVNI